MHLDLRFNGAISDKAYAIKTFEAHVEEVKRTIPKERLLVYQVGEGWESLCTFLNVPIPDKPFPRLNDRVSFGQNQRRDPQDLLKAL